MTTEEVIDLLTLMASYDRRTVGNADVAAWRLVVGDLADAGGLRRLKITVKVPLPEPFELTGEVAANEVPSALKVA